VLVAPFPRIDISVPETPMEDRRRLRRHIARALTPPPAPGSAPPCLHVHDLAHGEPPPSSGGPSTTLALLLGALPGIGGPV